MTDVVLVPPIKKRRKKSGGWSQSVGPWGFKVALSEKLHKSGPTITAQIRDRSMPCGYRTESLRKYGITDRAQAVEWATEQSLKWQKAGKLIGEKRPTASRIFEAYLTHRTPTKVLSEQQADRRRAAMWKQVLGEDFNLADLRLADWETFIAQRRTGARDAEGNIVAPDDRRTIRDSTVWGDCVFLNTAMNWATKWRGEDGAYLMKENPARGFPMPREKNPRRPYATQDRFEKIIAVARQVHPFLAPILTIINGTGRRITATLKLRFQDLQLARTKDAPHGAIAWPRETDKVRKSWTAPIDADVRGALDAILRERPHIGSAPLFPSPDDPAVPVSRYIADRWLISAEKLAEVPKHQGSLWHAYRRQWATERMHLPRKLVAAAGGWSDPATLEIYQQVTPEGLLAVVEGGRELREAQHG